MANYYLDFIGLNTFIYEPVGYDLANQKYLVFTKTELVTNGEVVLLEQNTFQPERFVFGLSPHDDLQRIKNFHFPAHLVDPMTGVHATNDAGLLRATASFFPALMLHRNGPYGFPTWKQIRVGDNPLTRKQRKENIFTFVREPGEEFSFQIGGRTETLRSKYGAIEAYKEAPVVSKYKPVMLTAKVNKQRTKVAVVLGNDIVGFANDELNRYYKLDRLESEDYEALKNSYLKGGLQSNQTPVDEFERFVYRETVFPQRLYTYRKFKRQRTTFSFPWRDDRANRTPSSTVDNGLDQLVKQSIWPMDVESGWATRPITDSRFFPTDNDGISFRSNGENDSGILMNSYSRFSPNLEVSAIVKGAVVAGETLSVAPMYSRRHMMQQLTSAVAPSGMYIEGINTGTEFNVISVDHLPSGEAFWDAPSQSNNAPFYDSYDLYFENLRGRYKDYSILPEFRISNHVRTYQSTATTEENLSLFELTGGLANTTGSAETDFYKIFTNSDFLEHFEIIEEDHGDITDPTHIMLKCKAVKKFLPYDGFYPQQRTADIARQFYTSYSGSTLDSFFNMGLQPNSIPFGFQPIMNTLFAPGVLFNSIKAGVACDYPIFTGSVLTLDQQGGGSFSNDRIILSSDTPLGSYAGSVDTHLLKLQRLYNSSMTEEYNIGWDRRIPFRALYEPERYLTDYTLVTNEPHPSGNVSGSATWDGTGDNLYKLMIHNFLAEVPEFFMPNSSFSTIISKKSSDPTVGNAARNRTYMMRVKMYKSMLSASAGHGPEDSVTLTGSTPQVTSSANKETFTMYSRPSAFGPPSSFVYKGDPESVRISCDHGNLADNDSFTITLNGERYKIIFANDARHATTDSTFTDLRGVGAGIFAHVNFQSVDTTSAAIADALATLYSTVNGFTAAVTLSTNCTITRDEPGDIIGTNVGEFAGSTAISINQVQGATIVEFVETAGYRGNNYQFTPPYYYGQGWADIKFTATESKKYSINEIIRNSTVQYYRYLSQTSDASTSAGRTQISASLAFNDTALQLSASLSLFGKASVKQIGKGANEQTIIASTLENDDQQWVIMPHFETPMLNFNHLSASDSITLPLNGSQSVPRGMWHQYGLIEEDPQKGIFMQVTDVPNKHIEKVLDSRATFSPDGVHQSQTTGSLMELCGFDSNPVKMGKIADTKRISEAVVAVPFLEEDGRRKFFTLDRDEVTVAELIARGKNVDGFKRITGINANPSRSIQRMVSKMKNYVFPPPMDFCNDRDIDPFAMYIFEFHHALKKQDLANIWQGLMPKIGTTHQESVAFFGHRLLKKELLGLDNQLPSKLKWMVFKVKKRAKTNYYEKILDRTKGVAGQIGALDSEFKDSLQSALGETNLKPGVSFNWPYDFFSLVELAKLDTSVVFKPEQPIVESPPPPEPPPLPPTPPPPEPKPKKPRRKKFKRKLYMQRYYSPAGFTENFYTSRKDFVAGVHVPIIEQVPGDQRIELRRIYFSAAGITEIQFKYDKKNPKQVSGDQT